MNIPATVLKDVFSGNYILYASVPITTSFRYLEWLKTAEDPDDLDARYRDVVTPNVKSARKAIAQLRRRLHRTVIDPSQLENVKLDWDQVDYYRFWDTVIREVSTEVVFMDGWAYSTGCCHELISALEAQKPIYTQDHTPLTVEAAAAMIDSSLTAYREQGIENESLAKVLARLNDFLPQ